jgi:hypothetical protein
VLRREMDIQHHCKHNSSTIIAKERGKVKVFFTAFFPQPGKFDGERFSCYNIRLADIIFDRIAYSTTALCACAII